MGCLRRKNTKNLLENKTVIGLWILDWVTQVRGCASKCFARKGRKIRSKQISSFVNPGGILDFRLTILDCYPQRITDN
jgi:hypothetical protein